MQQNGRFPQTQHVHIVRDVGAGGSPVDDATAHRALLGKGANLGHHVVARLFFNFQSAGNVNLPGVGLQIGQLLGGDQPGLVLGRGQRQPNLAHQPPLVVL